MDQPPNPINAPRQAETITYQEVLNNDTRPVPDILRENCPGEDDLSPIPVLRYFDEGYFQKEIDKVWLKTWQYAVREEEIPNPGDTYVFELIGRSLLIVRQKDRSIKALQNVCLHRGRRLATHGGTGRESYRCPYHGFTWNTDGSLKSCPTPWDFPQLTPEKLALPEVLVETWAGFVFVNFDPDAQPLMEMLDPLPRHFARWGIDDSYKAAHVGKVMPGNWKACIEAFVEALHVTATHPQMIAYIADANTQVDILSSHVDRMMTPIGFQSPQIDAQYSETQVFSAMVSTGSRAGLGETKLALAEGMRARVRGAELARARLEQTTGHDFSQYSDAEVLDGMSYQFFPNFALWGSAGTKTSYRWRPWNGRNDQTLMEVFLIARNPKDGKGKPAAFRMLGENELWSSATELGFLAGVFDQDQGNLGPQHEGLRNLGRDGVIHFGRYTELRCRHLHKTLDAYMAR